MQQYLLLASVFGTVAAFVWWISSLLTDRDDVRLRDRLRRPDAQADQKGVRARLKSSAGQLGQLAARPFMPKTQQRQSAIRVKLGYAGIYSPAAVRTMTGFKVLALLGGILGGYALGMTLDMAMLGAALGGLAGYMLPTLWLRLRISAQQKALERGLPDALDLLVVCVEAGLTVDAAMQRVSEELVLAHPPLARELEITHMGTRVGVSRTDALRNLGARSGSQALQMLATMLIQAERFGTSIAHALRVHADSLRVQRQNRAEEIAAKASVKLTFPLVLFIFPAVLIVLIGPAVIGLVNSQLFK